MDWKDIAVRQCKCGDPNMRRQIVSGNLQLFWCPRCGRLLKEVRDCGCCYQEVRDKDGVSLGPKAMDPSKCDKVVREEWSEPESVVLIDGGGVEAVQGVQGFEGPQGHIDPDGVVRFGLPESNEIATRLKQMDQKLQGVDDSLDSIRRRIRE